MPSNNDATKLNTGAKRNLLIWVGAAIEQLHIWETVLAKRFALKWNNNTARDPHDGRGAWTLDVHRHFLMVALNHMLTALEITAGKGIYHINIDPIIKDEIKETRDLLEHWKENAPIFNTMPRPAQPKYTTGKSFAERNPEPASPYHFLAWSNKTGPRLTPNVTSADVWRILDLIVDDFRASDDEKWDDYLPEPKPRAWRVLDTTHGDEWWPASMDAS